MRKSIDEQHQNVGFTLVQRRSRRQTAQKTPMETLLTTAVLSTYLIHLGRPPGLFDNTRFFHLSLSFIKVFSSLISAKPVSSGRLSM